MINTSLKHKYTEVNEADPALTPAQIRRRNNPFMVEDDAPELEGSGTEDWRERHRRQIAELKTFLAANYLEPDPEDPDSHAVAEAHDYEPDELPLAGWYKRNDGSLWWDRIFFAEDVRRSWHPTKHTRLRPLPGQDHFEYVGELAVFREYLQAAREREEDVYDAAEEYRAARKERHESEGPKGTKGSKKPHWFSPGGKSRKAA